MNLKISKDNGVKGLLRGWTLDETGIEMKRGSGMGKAFTDANPQSENYGLYPPEKEESKTYSDLQTNFRKALELLEQFADNAAQGMLLIPTGSDKSGLSDTAAGLAELVRQFGALWAQSQRALEEADDALEAYKNSKLIGLQASENMTLIDRHARRLDAMKKWNAQYKPGKEPKNYAQQTWEYYKSLSGNPGIGFGRYLEKKTEDIVYTFPKISIYEKERFKALTDKYTERIYLVEELAGKNWEVTWKAMAEDERKKKDKEIREAYEGKGGEAYDHRSLVQDKEVLIKFLQKKKDELVEPLTEQKTRAEELSKGKKADNEKDRAAFFKKFADKLDKTKHKEILFMFGNSGLLLNYEKKRVQQKRTIVNTLTDDDDSIAYMKEYQSDLPAKDRSEEQQKLLRTEYYKAATIDDLIEFETENNLGTGGKRLLRYLETGDKVRQGGALLDQILGDSKEHALSDFKERLAAREKDENLKFMSLEDIKKHLSYSDENREKQESFLEQSRLILAAEADPKKRKEMETEEVKAYFNRFAKEAQNYQENLGSGKEINLELMKDVLLHNEKNERMKMLQEAKKKGLSDAQVNQEYNKKYSDQQDALRWFLQRKYPDKGAEQIKNFYRVKLRERNEKHLDRLLKLEELTAKGANYRTMLDEYGKLGGGEEYAESIRKELLDNRGVVDGVKFKMETAQKIASESIETVGKAFNSSIEDIKKKSEAGVDDATLLRNFDEKKKDDWGMIKKVTGFLGVNWRSELEKSLSEESLTPGQLILYEKLERDRAGKAHEERLKALYGVEELPEDISKLSTPSQAVWDERVSAYRERAKRFKSQDEAKDLMGHVENYMKNSSGLGGQIVEYEEGRLSHYKEKLTELTQVQLDLQERCRVVREQMDLSSDMVENLDKIQNKPGVIYAKIAEFKKAVNWTEKDEAKQKQEGAENAKVLNKSAELLKKDDDEEE
jgi:hypothetical protein